VRDSARELRARRARVRALVSGRSSLTLGGSPVRSFVVQPSPKSVKDQANTPEARDWMLSMEKQQHVRCVERKPGRVVWMAHKRIRRKNNKHFLLMHEEIQGEDQHM